MNYTLSSTLVKREDHGVSRTGSYPSLAPELSRCMALGKWLNLSPLLHLLYL